MKRLGAVLLLMAASIDAEYTGATGSRIYYEASGQGTTAVVLIHGWSCDATFWRFQVSELSKHFKVLAIDLPGHGKSDKPDVPYTAKLFSGAVQSAMDANGIQRAVLAGHSMGSLVIRQVIAEAPERVLGVVSIDGSIVRTLPESFIKQVEERVSSMRGPEGLETRRKLIESMFTSATPPELRSEILAKMLATPSHVAASAMDRMVNEPAWRTLAPITAPALALNKKSEGLQNRRVHEEVFKNLQYVELEGVSHFLHMEQPRKVNDIITQFLRGSVPR
ncbi:MAG TPA: alpha/beta hydrolase [Bryobacteraceae bacterium]|nr:alpha/beta hydrolase [Bryobacteraceae bacterium]